MIVDKFYDKPVDLDALAAVRALFRFYKVKFRIRRNTRNSYAHPFFGWIQIGMKEASIQDLLSASFHELSHVLAFRNNKFMSYHGYRPMSDIKKNVLAIKTALRAEKYVDKMARELMGIYFPDIPYASGYDDKRSVDWFKNVWLTQWKLELAEQMTKKDRT